MNQNTGTTNKITHIRSCRGTDQRTYSIDTIVYEAYQRVLILAGIKPYTQRTEPTPYIKLYKSILMQHASFERDFRASSFYMGSYKLYGRNITDTNDGLYVACMSDDIDLAKCMLQYGADDYKRGLTGAYWDCHMDLIKLMLKHGIGKMDLDATNVRSVFNTIWAYGRIDIAEILIKNYRSYFNVDVLNSVLWEACRTGNTEIVESMLQHGADGYNFGLFAACIGGYTYLVKLMIKHGANDYNRGLTYACFAGNINLAKLMLSYGASNWNDN